MTNTPANIAVWTEIPVRDLDAGIAFYSSVTGCAFDKMTMGPNETATFRTNGSVGGVAGHLYVGAPASDGRGPTVHLAVAGPLEEAIERVAPAGGTVLSEPVAIPAGRFVYITDPDGNSVGLFAA